MGQYLLQLRLGQSGHGYSHSHIWADTSSFAHRFACVRIDGSQSRCFARPESNDDVVLELDMPFWTDPEDVSVDIKDCDMSVHVRGSLDMRRSYWRNACAHCNNVNRCCGVLHLRSRAGVAVPDDAGACMLIVPWKPGKSWLL